MPFAGKPILGIVGGIASGKSHVSNTLASLGCCVIDSDAVAHAIYRQPEVIQTLREWYGMGVIDAEGGVDRRKIGAIVFRDPSQRKRLEALLHPLIHLDRNTTMQRYATDPSVRAFVWDSPLLIEAGLHLECDAILFIDTPHELRLERVRQSRGWDAAELDRRESSQIGLDAKRELATDTIDGTLAPDALREKLDAVLTRVQGGSAR
jgi:dephospho-CoA kinase